jgi:uncharacterized membrane protein YqgA involved in biofilm formation
MLGTIVNAGAIILGGIVGLLFKGKIPELYHKLVFDSLSLCVVLIGLLNAFKVENLLLVIFSLVFGSIIGQWLDLEKRLENFSYWIEKKFIKAKPNGEESAFSKGFVTTTLVYCVGSMAVVGSFESGLSGNHSTLFAKAALDGMSAVLFAASLGFGVAFSSIPVFLYQGALTLSASALKPFITEIAIADMSAAGGLIIVALGLKMLEIKKMPVANMLPAIFIPLIYYAILYLT